MGVTHLDAGVIIAVLDGDDVHHEAARSTLSAALADAERLSMAASALAECLVGPARRGPEEVEHVRSFIARLPVSVVDLDEEIATQAAVLQAQHRSLKLPDALIIATAVHSGAARLITTDRRWPSAKAMELNVSIQRL